MLGISLIFMVIDKDHLKKKAVQTNYAFVSLRSTYPNQLLGLRCKFSPISLPFHSIVHSEILSFESSFDLSVDLLN